MATPYIDIVDNQIQSWKSEEIEAAYQAYKNGASSKVPWWGYQVEKKILTMSGVKWVEPLVS